MVEKGASDSAKMSLPRNDSMDYDDRPYLSTGSAHGPYYPPDIEPRKIPFGFHKPTVYIPPTYRIKAKR